MSNIQDVLDYLSDRSPDKICDACLLEQLSINPFQQVNQISNKLHDRGLTTREQGKCSDCGRTLYVNSRQLSNQVSKTPLNKAHTEERQVEQSFKQIDIEKERNIIAQLCLKIWQDLNKPDARKFGLSQIICILRDEKKNSLSSSKYDADYMCYAESGCL